MVTVGLVHRRDVWSAGVASVVARCGFQFAGQWSHLDDAIDTLSETPPDVLILSRRLVGQRSGDRLLQTERRPAIILLLEPEDRIYPHDLDEFPIEGLLFSDASESMAQECIRSVAAGHAWIDASILRLPVGAADRPDWTCLSDRELEVAHLAATGLSNKRIAQSLRVSDGTVKIHMHHILGKLHLERRSDLCFGDQRFSKLYHRGAAKPERH